MMDLQIYRQNGDIIKRLGKIPTDLIPKTKEESIICLAEYGKEYYATLKPRDANECINSPVCTLGAFKRATTNEETGDTTVRAIVLLMLTDCVSFFNVGKTMTQPQLAQTADMIIDDYGYLKIDDFKLLFTYAKKGYYGQLYDCIDGNVILLWIEKYVNDRINAGEAMSDREHDAINDKNYPSFQDIYLDRRK